MHPLLQEYANFISNQTTEKFNKLKARLIFKMQEEGNDTNTIEYFLACQNIITIEELKRNVESWQPDLSESEETNL